MFGVFCKFFSQKNFHFSKGAKMLTLMLTIFIGCGEKADDTAEELTNEQES